MKQNQGRELLQLLLVPNQSTDVLAFLFVWTIVGIVAALVLSVKPLVLGSLAFIALAFIVGQVFKSKLRK